MTLPLSITTLNGHAILFAPGLPLAFTSFQLQGATPYYAHSDSFGHLIYQQITTERYTAWVSHYIITNPADFRVTANVSDLLMHYTVKGTMYYMLEDKESPTSDHQLNIVIADNLHHVIRFKSPGIYIAVNVHLPIVELEEYTNSFPVVNPFLEKIEHGDAVTLLEQSMVAPERLRNIINDIMERQLPSIASEKYREQKTGELIIESLDMLSRYLTDNNGLNAADHEKGERTEIHLLQHLQASSPPTLKQLAKFAGTNEKKLEDIFRCRHGLTVYDFFQNARMKIIYRKLTETYTPLQDLAEEFGYTDYSSFSYAVKKRFAFSPRELRKKSKLV
ncbi:helix-turn-helix domain-containing protein [Chitinophaga oryziterrae]|uniref:Helix-turn-helix domain-containing protein n=1 Tax=Chitinophaga oryziterrae TaxID=1031224 RepID=A0A6N8JJV8_9BACT|nr:AraC family transcriptional regulator [Chitinophaga oryziterrae]MVT44666.1 helix-turn-helix domain-containing protein [Chitinophaga oryziterrae]